MKENAPRTPDEVRSGILKTKVARTVWNVSEWWGVTPDQAIQVLEALRDEVKNERRVCGKSWPDQRRASYHPGTPDDELREMAYRAVDAIATQGVRPSQRNVWAWCKARGARKRQALALRIVGNVVAFLCAGEVASTYVGGGHRAAEPHK